MYELNIFVLLLIREMSCRSNVDFGFGLEAWGFELLAVCRPSHQWLVIDSLIKINLNGFVSLM